MTEELISEVDVQTGLSKCTFTVGILDYIDERQVIMSLNLRNQLMKPEIPGANL